MRGERGTSERAHIGKRTGLAYLINIRSLSREDGGGGGRARGGAQTHPRGDELCGMVGGDMRGLGILSRLGGLRGGLSRLGGLRGAGGSWGEHTANEDECFLHYKVFLT